MGDAILDAFIDSLKILAVVLVFSIIIALIEPKLSKKIRLKGKLAPLIGVSVSLLPQCGFSIVATDLFHKRHITVGTLIGVYLATSDEALPIFLSNPKMAVHVLPLLAFKFLLGLIIGYTVDFVCTKSRNAVNHHVEHCKDDYLIRLTHCEGAQAISKEEPVETCTCEQCQSSTCTALDDSTHSQSNSHNGCTCECDFSVDCDCHNDKQSNLSQTTDDSANLQNCCQQDEKAQKKEKTRQNLKTFFVHPLLHSLEIFAYVLVVNIIFAIIIFYVGEDRIVSFLTANKYVAPFFSVLVGAIPNCVSSVLISELYLMGGLGFGATLGGLCMNAGLGFIYLFKNTKSIKTNLAIFAFMLVISVAIAYIFSAIFSFDVLHLPIN